MAESQLSVLSNQCLDRRIPDPQTLIREIVAWEKDRNKQRGVSGSVAIGRLNTSRSFLPLGAARVAAGLPGVNRCTH
jgi:hypothetical protein